MIPSKPGRDVWSCDGGREREFVFVSFGFGRVRPFTQSGLAHRHGIFSYLVAQQFSFPLLFSFLQQMSYRQSLESRNESFQWSFRSKRPLSVLKIVLEQSSSSFKQSSSLQMGAQPIGACYMPLRNRLKHEICNGQFASSIERNLSILSI